MSTDLEKLLHMGGKELFTLLEDKIEQQKITRQKATRIYEAWLGNRGYVQTGDGWIKLDEDTASVARDIGLIV